MFTGLIQNLGKIERLQFSERGAKVQVSHQSSLHLNRGDSVAVNGVCLTAVDCDFRSFTADLSFETLSKTTLKSLSVGDTVNLETPLKVGAPLGGHMVQGHIDGVGTVTSIESEGHSWKIQIQAPKEFKNYIVAKGSIAVDGVSLTVNDITLEGIFSLMIIPHTWVETSLHNYKIGTIVNLEVDIWAKYIEKALRNFQTADILNLRPEVNS